uniref:amidohydrolase family protein n=1 Tax=uncultured Eubacterium sp. TaxID=165185 RepID=UPI0028055AAC
GGVIKEDTYIAGDETYHSVWINDDDIEIYKEKGIWAVINACSNAKLASGVAPVSKLLKKGIKTAIGTDGAASNNSLDMFKEMYMIEATQKLADNDAASTNPIDVLKIATIGSARCMGLYDCDVIDVGKKADLIVIDMQKPSMQPINNILKNIVYSGSKDIVKMTMVNGRILYENGEFKSIDTEKIYKNAQRATDRLKQ